MNRNSSRRALLLRMFETAVGAAHPSVCLPPWLPEPPAAGRLIIVGAGKAAAGMAVACEAHYAARGLVSRIAGAVVTRHGARLPTHCIEIAEAGHPVPDGNSERAAGEALRMVRTAGPDDLVLCLLSGGASALWALPVTGVGLAEKQSLTRQLLRSGATIQEINTVRKHLSAIKGGRLVAAAFPASVLTLAISDVVGDDPATIGSGPTVGDATTLGDARAVLARYGITPAAAIGKALEDPANETLKPGATVLAASRYTLVATPRAALAAAAGVAREAGYDVVDLGDGVEGEARVVAARHAEAASALLLAGRRAVLMSGGELTVTVSGAGRGGPNQEYALALAIALEGREGICALAADTDGIDGGSGAVDDPAGAIVLPDTLARAGAVRNAAMFLAQNDSSAFFEPIGDLVRTGPTGTNVNDFRAIVVDP